MARLGPRVTATAQDARSQARNRELALERLRDRLEAALHARRARRPSPAKRRGAAPARRSRSAARPSASARAGARTPAETESVVALRRDSGWPCSWCSPSRAGAGSTCSSGDSRHQPGRPHGARDARRRRRHGEGATRRRTWHADRALHRRRHAGVGQARRAPVQCFGKQASEFNERLVTGRRVRLRGRPRAHRPLRPPARLRLPARGRRPVRERRAACAAATRARSRSRPTPIRAAASTASSAGRASERRGLWSACAGG